MALRRRTKLAIGIASGLGLGLALMGVAMAGGLPGGRPRVPPQPGPGGDGKIFRGGRRRDTGATPPMAPSAEEFDYTGNGVLIDSDCEIVVEGEGFWNPAPERFDLDGNNTALGEACTVASYQEMVSTVQRLDAQGNVVVRSGSEQLCSVNDVIDSWLILEGQWDPIQVAQRLLREISPLCADVNPDFWGDGLFTWYNDTLERIARYIPEKVAWLDRERSTWRENFAGGANVPDSQEIIARTDTLDWALRMQQEAMG